MCLIRLSIRNSGNASSPLDRAGHTTDTCLVATPLMMTTETVADDCAAAGSPASGTTITVHPLRVPARVRPEDAALTTLASFVLSTMAVNHLELVDHDVVVVTSKLVSLFEGRTLPLSGVRPGRKARWLGRVFIKDPRKLQLVMEEGRVLLVVPMKRITRIPSVWRRLLQLSPDPAAMRAGFDSTNAFTFISRKHAVYMDEAGIDHSNAPDGFVSMLPPDPCDTAERLRAELNRVSGCSVAVIITDTTTSIGRLGCQDVAIGFAGIRPVRAGMFRKDLLGVPRSGGTEIVIDSIAAVAGLAMGQSDERKPIAIVRGVAYLGTDGAPGTPDADAEAPTETLSMEMLAWPADAGVRMVIWSLLATIWFHIMNALSFSRWPIPAPRRFRPPQDHDRDRDRDRDRD